MFIYLRAIKSEEKKRFIINHIHDGDCSYFEVTFYNKIKDRTVKRAIRRCGKALPIAADGITLPNALHDRLINNEAFDRLLIINAFCEIARGQKSALICDPDGCLSPHLFRALTAVQTLYIYTERADIYESLAAKALKTVGSSPIIVSDPSAQVFPIALTTGDILPRAKILLGQGGFLHCREEVLFKGRHSRYVLSAAKYSCKKEQNPPFYLPERLKSNAFSATPAQLKKMLDTR